MADARIFWVGLFATLWVVMFFGFSAYEIRKTYAVVAPKDAKKVTGS